MMKMISDQLRAVSTGWITIAALIIFVAFMVFVLPGQASQSDDAANDAGTPDLMFIYTVNDLYSMAETYGEQGRRDYVKARFTFDLIWPLVYGFLLVTSVSWLFGKVFPMESIWQRANLIPVFGVLFDYLENISTSVVMARFPAQTGVIDFLATIFTPIKWTLVVLSFILLLTGLALLLTQRLWRR